MQCRVSRFPPSGDSGKASMWCLYEIGVARNSILISDRVRQQRLGSMEEM